MPSPFSDRVAFLIWKTKVSWFRVSQTNSAFVCVLWNLFPVYLVGGPCCSHLLPGSLPVKLPGWPQLLPALEIRHSPPLLLLLPLDLALPVTAAFKEIFFVCLSFLLPLGELIRLTQEVFCFSFLFFLNSVEYFIYLPCVSLEVMYSFILLFLTALTDLFNFFRSNVNWFFYPLPKQGSFDHFNSACRCPHLCALL